MLKSIRWKFVMIYVLLVSIVMVFSGALIIVMVNNSEYTILENDLKQVVDVVSRDINFNGQKIEVELQTSINNVSGLYLDKKLFLLDDSGDVIYTTSTIIEEEIKNKPQVIAALNNKDLTNLDSNVRFNGDQDTYIGYAKTIEANDGTRYVIYVAGSTSSIVDKTKKIINVIFIAIIIAIIISIALGTLFSGFLSNPIAVLTQRAKEMAAGKLEDITDVQSDDEIGQLTQSFNDMAKSLSDTMGQISSEKNKLEFLFSQITDGIVVFNQRGVLTHTNPASLDMLDISGKSEFDDIFFKYIHESFEDIAEEVLNGTITNVIKVRERYFNISLAKFSNSKETLVGVICVIQDITEHKKLELMQKEFVANVSHELRTPITTIKSYTETLLDGAIDEQDIALNFLNVINNESDRMTDLVKDLLDLSRLDNKQTKFDMQNLNLSKLVKESVEKLRIHADKNNQALIYHESDEVYNIFGDANRVEQVVKNVISNAMKYSPKEARIEITTYKEDQQVVVAVKDNGFGIPKNDIGRIFERFYRVNKARSREMGGTGLGLSIAKEIVDYHGGTIEVESVLEEGTIFYLKFPILKNLG